jgi:hypothetical protein
MKKTPRKLRLTREALRKLAGPELGQVVGAIHTEVCPTGDCLTAEVSCNPSFSDDTCDTACC